MSLKQNKKKVLTLLEQLDWVFAIQNFDRAITFSEEQEVSNQEQNVACCVEVRRDYQEIHVILFPHFFDHTLPEQRKLLLHELCHTIPNHLAHIAEDLLRGVLHTEKEICEAKEEATSKIENIIHKLFCGNMKYAKTAYKEYLK